MMRNAGKVLLSLTGLVALIAGGRWLWQHRFDLPGSRDVTISEGEVVDGIEKINRLVVFRAYITSTTTTHQAGWVFTSDQTMLTPAYVNYFVDMTKVTSSMVRIRDRQVFVALPPLMIERPNIDVLNVQTFNAGVWSNLTSTGDRMRIANSKLAVSQLYSRAKMPFLVDAARRAAVEAVTANVQVALAANGHPDVTIRVIP